MIKKASAVWNKFFFQQISPATLGVFRIVFGLVVLDSLLGKFSDRELFYSDRGVVRVDTVATFFRDSDWARQILHLIPSSSNGLTYFFVGLIVATALLTLGAFTRVTSILVFFGLLVISDRNIFGENAGDDIIRINSFFLMFANAGAAYSFDSWFRLRGRRDANLKLQPQTLWAVRLLQLQASYIYLDTVFLKFHGHAWLDGTAMYYALNYSELKRFEFQPFFYYLWQIKLFTWGTLLVESAMFSLVWFKRFRYWVLAAALVLHMGINLVMQFPIFEYVMIANLILFVDPGDIGAVVDRLAKHLRLKTAA